MAKQAREDYLNIPIDICYCSPLIRARETAELVLQGRNYSYYMTTVDLRWALEYMRELRIVKIFQTVRSACCFGILSSILPETVQESMQELWERTGRFLSEIVYPQLKEGKNILIVGHGAMNSSILCQVKHIPLQDFWKAGIPNCKLMKLC